MTNPVSLPLRSDFPMVLGEAVTGTAQSRVDDESTCDYELVGRPQDPKTEL
jgi:hypothetical protein